MSNSRNEHCEDSEHEALRDRNALVAFCEAEMEIRQLKHKNKEVLTRLRQEQKNSMQVLLSLMQSHNVECVGIREEREGGIVLARAHPKLRRGERADEGATVVDAECDSADLSRAETSSGGFVEPVTEGGTQMLAGRDENVDDATLNDAGEPTAYVRIGKAYTTRELSGPFLKAVLYQHYTDIVEEVNVSTPINNDEEPVEAAGDEEDEPDVMRVVKVLLKFINKMRTTEKTVVLISKKRPRHVSASDVAVITETSILHPALQTFTRNKTALTTGMAELREAKKGVEAQLNNSMGIVQQYMEKNGDTSRAIVLSKFNNQKMMLKCKVVLHKPPVQVSMVRDIAVDVFREVKLLKSAHDPGAWFSAEVLNNNRESIIENIVTQVTAKRPVFKKSIIKLDKAREAARNPR